MYSVRRNVVDRIVLVNPATSFEESIWPLLGPLLPQVPNQLFPFVPYAFAPFFGNPIQLLMRNIDLAAAPDVLAGQLIEVPTMSGKTMSQATSCVFVWHAHLEETIYKPFLKSWPLSGCIGAVRESRPHERNLQPRKSRPKV